MNWNVSNGKECCKVNSSVLLKFIQNYRKHQRFHMKWNLCIRQICWAFDEHFMKSISIEMLIHPEASWACYEFKCFFCFYRDSFPIKNLLRWEKFNFHVLWNRNSIIYRQSRRKRPSSIISMPFFHLFSLFGCYSHHLIYRSIYKTVLQEKRIQAHKKNDELDFIAKQSNFNGISFRANQWNCGDAMAIFFFLLRFSFFYLIN